MKNNSYIKLIFFLGNPGDQYKNTRHNIGFKFCDFIGLSKGNSWQNKFKGMLSQSNGPQGIIYLLKPMTYMNKCGECLNLAKNFHKIDAQEILVIHDEAELDFGSISIKKGGGLKGHNGLKSIVQHIGSDDFFRFKIGIRGKFLKNLETYVLNPFSKEEEKDLPFILNKSENVLTEILNAAEINIDNYKLIKII